MSDVNGKYGRTTFNRDAAQPPLAEPQLELLAIEERFLAEWRAGHNPQLSKYLQWYPDHAASLATFVARTFTSSGSIDMPLLEDDAPDTAHNQPAPLSPGTRQALDTIFANLPQQAQSERLLVAEASMTYDIHEAMREDGVSSTQNAVTESTTAHGEGKENIS